MEEAVGIRSNTIQAIARAALKTGQKTVPSVFQTAPKQKERVRFVEEVIRRLVEYDEKGQQLVQEALDRRREVMNRMGDYKQEMANLYRDHLARHMEDCRREAQAEKEAQFVEARRRYDLQMEHLRKTYQENGERWIQEIVSRCIGG